MSEERRNLMEAMDEATVRFDVLIWLPGALAGGSMPDSFKDEFAESLSERPSDPIYTDLPELMIFAGPEDPDPEAVADMLLSRSRTGFIAQVATPVMTKFGRGHSYSWGHYSTCWRYADTLEGLADIAIKWASEQPDRLPSPPPSSGSPEA